LRRPYDELSRLQETASPVAPIRSSNAIGFNQLWPDRP
jgi:hypothetical protein